MARFQDSRLRKLQVLCIDDGHGLRPAAYKDCLEVTNIKSVYDTQEHLVAAMQRGQAGRCDLLLCDINMQEREREDHPENVEWMDDTVRPYGVLLALPYLQGSRLATFVPYSDYWGDAAVFKNGYVLVAVSLVLAAMRGRPVLLQGVMEEIEEIESESGEIGLAVVPDLALRGGLAALRRKIEGDETIQLVDVSQCLTRLEDLISQAQSRKKAGTQAWPLPLPLADTGGTLGIQIYHSSAVFENIELTSLFADAVDFGPIGPEEANTLRRLLKEWLELSIECRREELFASAKAVLESVAPTSRGWSLLDVRKAVRANSYPTKDEERYLLRRIAILLAWVKAWRDEATPSERRTAVRQYLGFMRKTTVTTTAGGTRSEARMDRDVAQKYKGLLSPDRRRVSTDRWRRPFKSSWDNVLDAYSLDKDEPGALTALERSMCIQYAEEELGWEPFFDPDQDPYPLWMTEGDHG